MKLIFKDIPVDILLIFVTVFCFAGAAFSCALARESRAFVISGYLTDAKDSAPVEGAAISINGVRTKKKTDRGGYYELKLKPGKYEISFFKKGFSEGKLFLAADDFEPGAPVMTRNAALDPNEKNFKIKGRLIDRLSGEGVRAEMRINDEIVFSGHDGAFECLTYPGEVRVIVRSAAHRPYDKKFRGQDAEALRDGIEIFLQRYTLFSTAEGTVVEKKSGKPVFEAVVEIGGKRTMTNDRGEFSMCLNESGVKKLACSREGFKTVEKKVKIKTGNNKIKIYLDAKEKGLIEKLREKYEKEILN